MILLSVSGSSAPLIPECLPFGMKDKQENVDFADLAQQKNNFLIGNGTSSIIAYPGKYNNLLST